MHNVGTACIVLRKVDDHFEVLLIKRAENLHAGGTWAAPGGELEENEKISVGAERELKEEMDLDGHGGLIYHVCDREIDGTQWITLHVLYRPGEWTGTPKILEPHKHTNYAWCPLDDLPSPLFPGLEEALLRAAEWMVLEYT